MDTSWPNGSMRGVQTLERIEPVSTIAVPQVAAREPLEIRPPTNFPVSPNSSEAIEREQLLDRLQNLRRVLPALAQEMASARRQAARLRSDNRKLIEQVRVLRANLDERKRQS